jgi:hypothetical protein
MSESTNRHEWTQMNTDFTEGREVCLERKTFSPDFIFAAAELFTFGCGALDRALLPEW